MHFHSHFVWRRLGNWKLLTDYVVRVDSRSFICFPTREWAVYIVLWWIDKANKLKLKFYYTDFTETFFLLYTYEKSKLRNVVSVSKINWQPLATIKRFYNKKQCVAPKIMFKDSALFGWYLILNGKVKVNKWFNTMVPRQSSTTWINK